jgi:hypothetical protein
LLNFKKKANVSLKILPEGKLSKCLNSKITFLWLPVCGLNQPNLLESQAFHIHLKPKENEIAVEGEVT